MIRLNNDEILKLGKKHKKWNEVVTLETFPYVINDSPYFLAYYHSRFSTKTKEVAIVSPNPRKEDAYNALKPLLYFTVTFNNIDIGTRKRVELQFDVMEEIRMYLENIIESGVLKDNNEIAIYRRSFDIIDEIIRLQDEMFALRKEVQAISNGILDRGYIEDEDITKALELFPAPGWIQYNQFYKNFKYRSDFDVIYENSKRKELVSFHKFKDDNTLYNMTSKIAEGTLKNSLDNITNGVDMSNFLKEDFFNYWTNKYKNDLSIRYNELLKKIRYP